MRIVKDLLILVVIISFVFIFFVNLALGMEARILPLLCMDNKLFKETIVTKQKLFLLGTMGDSEHIIEVYRGRKLKWTLVARNPNNNEVCIFASGHQLFDADWFMERNLP
jgi:hypothetical protein